MKPKFVHHHVHGMHSLLDGLSSPMDIAQRIHELGMPGWSHTDHGTLAGAYDVTKAAKKYGLKANIGCELYFAENRHQKFKDRHGQFYYHLIAIATNMVGYKNLLKMQTAGHYEGFYRKPRVDFEILEKHHEGIIFTTACLGSHVNQALLEDDYPLALQRLGMLTDAVGRDNVYVEIQNQGLKEEARILPLQVQLAKDTGLPLLPTGDCHYTHPHQAGIHDSLLCVSTGRRKAEQNRFKFESDQFYIMSAEEMHQKFGDNDLYPNAMKNTLELMDRCDFTLPTGKEAGHIMPHINVAPGETEDSALRKRVFAGAATIERYGDANGNIPPEVAERLDYELGIVEKMGFAGYFHTVADICELMKQNDITVGAGRGSAPGSVAVYSLGITNVDPMKLGLYFERFLNPDRISFPDIDIDIPKAKRGKALRLLQEKYGEDRVAQISNFTFMQVKSAIQQACKVFGLSYSDETELKELVAGNEKPGQKGGDPGIMGKHDWTLQEVSDKYSSGKLPQKYRDQIKRYPHAQEILEAASSFVGVISAESIHACGLVIMPEPVDNFFPIRKPRRKDVKEDNPEASMLAVTQFDKDGVEDTGGVKMDLLGLENLDECEAAEKGILLDLGKHVDTSNLVPDDPEVYKMLAAGECSGVFQLSSDGMCALMRKMCPTSFADLTAALALYRPGPLGMGTHLEYCMRKNGEKPVNEGLPHPDMAVLLEETFGLVCFQEDLMAVAQKFAGYTGAEADHLRKATAKKIPEMMAEEKEKFVPAVNQRYGNNLGEKLWEILEPFAAYAFNKSHAAAYAVLSYRTAYLKHYYPSQFGAGILDNVGRSKKNNRKACISWMKRRGITINPPNINATTDRTTTSPDSIVLSMHLIDGIGTELVGKILKERQDSEFTSIVDFHARIKPSDKDLCNMILAGCFDGLHKSRRAMLGGLQDIKARAERYGSESTIRDGLFGDILTSSSSDLMAGLDFDTEPQGVVMVADQSFDEDLTRADMEDMVMSVSCGKHPYVVAHPMFAGVVRSNPYFRTTKPARHAENMVGDKAMLCGIITQAEIKTTKRGNRYLKFELSDDQSSVLCLYFQDVTTDVKDIMRSAVIVEGRIDEDQRGGGQTMKADKIHVIGKKRKKGK